MSDISEELKARIWAGNYSAEDVEAAERGGLSGASLASLFYSYATRLKAQGDADGYQSYLARAVDTVNAAGQGAASENDLDVRQSVLREAGRYEEAETAIERALAFSPSVTSKALLLVGRADVYMHTQKELAEARSVMEEVVRLAEDVARQDPRQGIRIYRALARFYKNEGDTGRMEGAKARALALIEETGAEDQRLKLTHDIT